MRNNKREFQSIKKVAGNHDMILSKILNCLMIFFLFFLLVGIVGFPCHIHLIGHWWCSPFQKGPSNGPKSKWHPLKPPNITFMRHLLLLKFTKRSQYMHHFAPTFSFSPLLILHHLCTISVLQ